MAFLLEAWLGLLEAAEEGADPRTTNLWLMETPYPTLITIAVYFLLVTVLIPRAMAKRPAFELRKTIIVYNFLQVLISAWLFYEALEGGWWGEYSLGCQPIDHTPKGDRIARAAWLYFLSKFTELLDTIFFALRKKTNQITGLHLFHHSIMPIACWFGVKMIPGGQGTFFGLLNTFVHIIMYAYYMLAAMGPSVQKYLWWKKHITTMQIIQFTLVLIHCAQFFFIECDFSFVFTCIEFVHAATFLFLFKNFYNKAYSKQKASPNFGRTSKTLGSNGHGKPDGQQRSKKKVK